MFGFQFHDFLLFEILLFPKNKRKSIGCVPERRGVRWPEVTAVTMTSYPAMTSFVFPCGHSASLVPYVRPLSIGIFTRFTIYELTTDLLFQSAPSGSVYFRTFVVGLLLICQPYILHVTVQGQIVTLMAIKVAIG